jgi:hypothetical protein
MKYNKYQFLIYNSDTEKWDRIKTTELIQITGLTLKDLISSFKNEYCQEINGKVYHMEYKKD